ncbi:MAG: tripartite tricarboxylate transporter TctB family protein [Bacteroidota bacterium]
MQLSDRVTGLFLVGLGGLAAYGGAQLPPVPGQQVGPNVFPMVVGAGLCLCGALIALGIGRHFEEEAEADLAAHSEQAEGGAEHTGWLYGLRALIPPALLAFYVFAVDRLGFLMTAAVIVLTGARALGARWVLAVLMAIGAPLLVSLAFGKLLRVPLPAGLLPTPW